ncbi:MAG: hypothetical protein GWP74_19980 [Proteobacteria bacterium]|nr:hypothetical protein [Pseudomonadota bacterium]
MSEALEIAQFHVERIAKARAQSRARLERDAPDLLRFADELREAFGAGVRMERLTMKEKPDD